METGNGSKTVTWAAAQEAKGKKAYTYFFSHIQNVNGQPSPAGATHTAEISFAWNNPKGQANQTWTETDTKLADQMSSYWVNFISKGDPNGAGLPKWPEFKSLTGSKVMVFGDAPEVEPSVVLPLSEEQLLPAHTNAVTATNMLSDLVIASPSPS